MEKRENKIFSPFPPSQISTFSPYCFPPYLRASVANFYNFLIFSFTINHVSLQESGYMRLMGSISISSLIFPFDVF